ncbi:MAG: AAA family ATPase [Muricoprocola sp.]
MADKKVHSLFDDLWGNPVRRPEAAPSKKTEKSVDLEDISSILDDLKQNIQEDEALLSTASSASPSPEEKKTDSAEGPSAPVEEETDPMEDLNNLVGLDHIKKDVADLINLVKMQKMRQGRGLKSVPVSLHLVFSGNPGTGKTTVARILARLYKQIGVLSKGQLVEVDRSALVAGYVGQTATKTQEKIKEAMGGILFIDEAYTLVKKEGNDFGQEAIDTLLKEMEDHRDDFVVIVAGYTKPMEDFINSNPGLKSRFNKYMYFEDYSKDELLTIFQGFCDKYQYQLDEAAQKAISEKLEQMLTDKKENFANAREVRNLFEKIITRQANRIGTMASSEEMPEITLILAEDVE